MATAKHVPTWTPNPAGSRPSLWWGLLALVLLTAIWGYCNIIIRQLEFSLTPAVILVVRYGAVGLVGMPWVFVRRQWSLKHGLGGLGVGALLAAATLSQARGMETIPVDSVAFITALYVVLTPLAMALWRHRRPHRLVWLAVAASLVGVGLLIGHLDLRVAQGTLWSLLAAFFATAQIIGTAELSQVMTTIQLTIIEALGAGVTLAVYLVIGAGFHQHVWASWSWHAPLGVWWRLLFLAALGTVVAGWLQVWGQRRLSATQAALTFNLEPVWTAVFAWLILSQALSWLKLLGAALIIGSLVALSASGEETDALDAPQLPPYREH